MQLIQYRIEQRRQFATINAVDHKVINLGTEQHFFHNFALPSIEPVDVQIRPTIGVLSNK